MPQRTPDRAIDPRFLRCWSPRAFTGEVLDEVTLLRTRGAARWVPSGYNVQPWRFLDGRAGALVLVLSQRESLPPGKEQARPKLTHAFDGGAAWGHLALQAREAYGPRLPLSSIAAEGRFAFAS